MKPVHNLINTDSKDTGGDKEKSSDAMPEQSGRSRGRSEKNRWIRGELTWQTMYEGVCCMLLLLVLLSLLRLLRLLRSSAPHALRLRIVPRTNLPAIAYHHVCVPHSPLLTCLTILLSSSHLSCTSKNTTTVLLSSFISFILLL